MKELIERLRNTHDDEGNGLLLDEAATWCDKHAAAEEHRRAGISITSRGAEAVIDRLNGSVTSARRSAEAIRAMKEPTT